MEAWHRSLSRVQSGAAFCGKELQELHAVQWKRTVHREGKRLLWSIRRDPFCNPKKETLCKRPPPPRAANGRTMILLWETVWMGHYKKRQEIEGVGGVVIQICFGEAWLQGERVTPPPPLHTLSDPLFPEDQPPPNSLL